MKCFDCGELIVMAEWPDKDGIEYIGDCEKYLSHWSHHKKFFLWLGDWNV